MEMVAGADDGAADLWRMLVPAYYTADPLSGNPDAKVAPIHYSLPVPPPTQEAWVDMEEIMNNGIEGLEGGDSMMQTRIQRFSHRLSGSGGPDSGYVVPSSMMQTTRIHRFPHHLRGIGGLDGRYVEPSVVAIGPYHHGKPHLQAMEAVKRAAVQKFCMDLARLSVDDVYAEILSIASHARSCYTADDGASIVAPSLSLDEFAGMMFRDGCFLLCFMHHTGGDQFLTGCTLSSGPSIIKDMFLLENQIPMFVLAALMELIPQCTRNCIARFVEINWHVLIEKYETKVPLWTMRFLKCGRIPEDEIDTDESSISHGDPELPAPHLLSLLRFAMIRHMPPQKRQSILSTNGDLSSLMISAVALAEKGIKLTVNTVTSFAADMSVQKKLFSCELSLSPLFLNDTTACWLVNLVALEAIEASAALRINIDGYVVSSYLSLLAMLLDKEEDVHKLRRKSVLRTIFSNAETLAFFKGVSKHVRLGYNYFNTLDDIEGYMRQRAPWVAIYKFFYNHGNKLKVAAAVLSAVSVLVAIFRAFYPAKQS
ncbi:hypothetical protein ACP4OV_018583 [Aristida adscensionis]